jgi:hypothetical protein
MTSDDKTATLPTAPGSVVRHPREGTMYLRSWHGWVSETGRLYRTTDMDYADRYDVLFDAAGAGVEINNFGFLVDPLALLTDAQQRDLRESLAELTRVRRQAESEGASLPLA